MRLCLILAFLGNRGAFARTWSEVTELQFGPTREEFCVDNGLDDEATCNNAHVLAPSEISPEFYGDPRPVHCCEWRDDQCTYGRDGRHFFPYVLCSWGKLYSKDYLYNHLVYSRELGSKYSASAVAV